MSSSPLPSPPDSRLRALIESARVADGHPPFSDGALAQLSRGARRVVWAGPAAALVSDTEAEFVVDPDARRQGHGRALLNQLLLAAHGDVLLWAHGGLPAARHLAASHGLEPVREVLRLRAAVAGARGRARAATDRGRARGAMADRGGGAVADRGRASPATPESQEWDQVVGEVLEVNARAFAGHPEQGQLTRAQFDALCAEPWFDAEDLLVLREAGKLLGFCWLKVERPTTTGEFYVVGVDPAHQGRGIGRQLMAAGFARLEAQGIREAELYVEAQNTAALHLYDEFGFREFSRDIQYRWHSEPVAG